MLSTTFMLFSQRNFGEFSSLCCLDNSQTMLVVCLFVWMNWTDTTHEWYSVKISRQTWKGVSTFLWPPQYAPTRIWTAKYHCSKVDAIAIQSQIRIFTPTVIRRCLEIFGFGSQSNLHPIYSHRPFWSGFKSWLGLVEDIPNNQTLTHVCPCIPTPNEFCLFHLYVKHWHAVLTNKGILKKRN